MIFPHLFTSIRIVFATMVICCALYTVAILGFGQFVMPETADGSLIKDDHGTVVGSALIAQKFLRPEYFWPRPSVVDYNAAAAGGSNLSPANPELKMRSERIIAKMGAGNDRPIPADLVTASGSGLDPHITMSAAIYQMERVAAARGLMLDDVMNILKKQAKRPGGVFTPDPLVNVLVVNMELDRITKDNH
jgi:potassium-transporting ATPase KdpC subunit